jgi:outer membrane protein OmpA-like peptidoglycan-associated protein
MIRRAALLLVLLSLCAPAALAGKYDQDVPGSKDIPGLPRDEGSVILGYKLDQYDEAALPLGKWVNASASWETFEKVEGRRTRILYLAPPDQTSADVMNHYKAALQRLNYTPLFDCSGEAECGAGVGNAYFDPAQRNKITGRQVPESAFSTEVGEPRVLTARLNTPGGQSQVFILAARQNNIADAKAGRRVAVFVEEVRSGQTQERLTLVPAEDMLRSIRGQGKAVLYGVHFSFDTAEIMSESRPQLEEMAKLLKAEPKLKVFVVVHTDNQGRADDNVRLAQRRAEALARLLAQDFGVPAERMVPEGLGSLSPVASNSTEAGRAKNRRVELVEQ